VPERLSQDSTTCVSTQVKARPTAPDSAVSVAHTAIPDRILRWGEVRRIVGQGRRTVDRQEKLGAFPRRALIGLRSVGWFESDVLAYVAELRRRHHKDQDV
jgi:predicted DNA-binding transcriptional regulator AlpA